MTRIYALSLSTVFDLVGGSRVPLAVATTVSDLVFEGAGRWLDEGSSVSLLEFRRTGQKISDPDLFGGGRGVESLSSFEDFFVAQIDESDRAGAGGNSGRDPSSSSLVFLGPHNNEADLEGAGLCETS